MNYTILIPVTTQYVELDKCTSKCQDKSKLIIVNNYVDRNVNKVCAALSKEGAEIIPFDGDNRGASCSWNIGLKRNCDMTFILSPSVYFDNSIQEFVDATEQHEMDDPHYGYYVPGLRPHLSDVFHCFAIPRRTVDKIGLFDENFYPAYYEDIDYCRRMEIGGIKVWKKLDIARQCLGQGLGVKCTEVFNHYWANTPHLIGYYKRKWGGMQSSEMFETPFNNPNLTHKDWTLEENQLIRLKDMMDKTMASVLINEVEDVDKCRYLELGVYLNANFNSISCIDKFSVDTNGQAMFTGTTDEFFASLTDERWDYIYIDANHDYEYVLRDFNNSVNRCNKFILIHDMFPPDEDHCKTQICSDSYKLLYYLLKNTEFNIYTLDRDYGLTFIKMPAHQVYPEDKYKYIVYGEFVNFMKERHLYSNAEIIEILNSDS